MTTQATSANVPSTAAQSNMPVRAQWIDIAPGFAGYLALPPSGTGPGLVVWPEIFGINPHIRGVAEQYALDGFVVLAPDVFWRQDPRVALQYDGADRQRAMTLMQGYTAPDQLADIGAAVDCLRARAEVAGAKVGSVGYCLGGKLSYLTAATAHVDAAVAYYGGGIHQQLDKAGGVSCPLQLHFAALDDHIPAEAIDQTRSALGAAGKLAEVHVYPGAQHGFNCWARGTYHPASAALAHGRSLAFLAGHLFAA